MPPPRSCSPTIITVAAVDVRIAVAVTAAMSTARAATAAAVAADDQ
jgi:hypothetical protein